MTGRTIKVKVEMTVEIDVEAYSRNYGASSDRQIRNDVKYEVLSAVSQTVSPDALVQDGTELLNATGWAS